MQKQAINLIWLKRDLRLRDHAPLAQAAEDGLPALIFYCFEPSLEAHPDYAPRHWRFICESLQDMQAQLKGKAAGIHIFHNEVLEVLEGLSRHFSIQNLYSHLEVGLKITFDRDKTVKRWCNTHAINWREFGQDAVIRGQFCVQEDIKKYRRQPDNITGRQT